MIVKYTRHNLLYRGSYEMVSLEQEVPFELAEEMAKELKAKAAKALGLEEITEEEATAMRKKLDRYERKTRF